MNVLKQYFFLISIFCFFSISAQKGFFFEKPSRSYVKVPFKLIGNLMVLDVKLNDIPLSFILDTGANHTFLFNLADADSLELKNTKRIKVNGLGSSESVASIKSSNNKFQIGGLVNNNQSIHLILDKEINFSSQLGVSIHGIIGCDLIENFITKINYSAHTLKFYKPENYKYDKLSKYEPLNVFLHQQRMYINANVSIETDDLLLVTLLLDTGSSDSVWLFTDKNRTINVPKKKFRDYMGTGIGGNIHGDRSRLKKIQIANYELSEAKVAFPDSIDIALAYKNMNRQGSLGAGILKRFNMVFDYGGKKMYLKKNRFFKKPFEYNMSGIQIEHNGLRVEKVYNGKIKFSEAASQTSNARNAYSINSLFKTSLVPVFEIVEVREGSPAALSGIQVGDILLYVNKKPTYKYQISEIVEMLSEKEGKELTLEVERKGEKMKFEFKLKRML